MIRKVAIFAIMLSLLISSSSFAFSISRDWQQTLNASLTVTIDRIQVYLAAGKDSSGVDTNEFQLSPYALRLANNTRVWVPGTTTQTDWYDAGSGYNPVATYWGVPNSSNLTSTTTTNHPVTGLPVTYIEPMHNWVSTDKKVAVIEAPSYIQGSFLGIREYWKGTVAPAQAYQATVHYQFYKDGVLVTSATYSKAAGSTSWVKTVTGTSSNWAQGFINIGSSFTITSSAGSNGSISPSGAVSVSSGANQTFTITPNSGYSVSQVTVDGANQGAITSYTFNNVTADHTISATFVANPTYTITASAGSGGSISPTGAVSVNSGANQTFTITPNSGYSVSQVTVDGANQGAITSYAFSNVTANHTISATFIASGLTITASAGAGGSISPSGAVSVSSGANQTFTITPNTGYSVTQVTVDGVNQGAITSYTFNNVTVNHTISATFTINTLTITASAASHGSITPSGAVSVNYGANQAFTITPDSGYSVSQLTVDGVNQGAFTSYTFTNVIANHTISATFVVTPPSSKVIDINAATIAGNDGDVVASWSNAGSVGGAFAIDGTDLTTRPVIATTQGKRCVQFDGSNDRLKLFNGSTPITTPAGITGNGDWTVTAMIYNPAVGNIEAYLCWASSAEVAPGRCGFLYGYHNGDGAVQHGTISGGMNYNMAFKPVPTQGVWHQVAVTFDGSVEKVYLDGVLNQTESKTLAVAAGHPFMLGCLFGTPTGGSTGTRFSGSIAALSVYDQALSATEINALANVTISGKVTGPTGADLAGAVVGFKNTGRGVTSATADADVYAVADASGNYTANVLNGNTYYVAAWKDGYTPTNDSTVVADSNKTVNLAVTADAGYNLAYGRTKEADRLYASATGLGANSINLGFDGSVSTNFSWVTTAQKDLVIDISKPDGTGESINGINLITNNYRAYDWEIWVENNADPIVSSTVNTGAAWTRVYQSIGGYGGFYRTSPSTQVVEPVKFAATNARGVWIKILNSAFADDNEVRPYEVSVYSSASVSSIASAKSQADGTTIYLDGNYATWAPRYGDGVRTTNYFYVEDAAKTAGIRVSATMQDTVKVNDDVSVIGTMATDANTGERYLNATLIPTSTMAAGIEPDAVNTYAVQNTASVVGKFVSVANCTVQQVAADGSWFTVTDASNGSIQTKVYVQGVQLPANLASIGDTINVIGAVAKEYSSGTTKSVIMLFNYAKPTGTADEFTFICISDIHYGATGDSVGAARATIDQMNALPGTAYPLSLGGNMQTPRGVIEIGDIADGGTDAQFDMFAFDYGINAECRLRYPVFEGLGNHDQKIGNPVSLRVKARNPYRRNLTGLSANGMHYSWDWNNVHFLQVNRIPADVTEPNIANAMVGDLCYALEFIEDDIAANVGDTGRPLFIAHHYGFDLEHSATWWTQNERTLYHNAISDYNVIGIAHGHNHNPVKYQWDGVTAGPSLPNSIDVFMDSSGYDKELYCPGGFFVFRVRNNQLAWAQWYYNPTTQQWGWGLYGSKTL